MSGLEESRAKFKKWFLEQKELKERIKIDESLKEVSNYWERTGGYDNKVTCDCDYWDHPH